jgi:hypothetical protein
MLKQIKKVNKMVDYLETIGAKKKQLREGSFAKVD